jgi:adhesin transport system outer membrane protein
MIIKFLLIFMLAFSLFALETNQKKEFKHLSEDPLFHADREKGLSIYEAMLRAIEQSPKLSAAAEVVVQEKEKKAEVEAGHLPTVDFTGDVGYEERQVSPDTLYTEKPSLTTISRYKKTDLYLTITQNLWAGGSIENSVDEKDANLKASLFDYRDKLETLVLDVATAYFNVVYAEIALKISKKNMTSYEKILNIVTIKEKNGAATKGDVNFIRANVDNAKTELVQKQKDVIDSLSKYVYLLQTEDQEEMPYEIESRLYVADLNTSLHDADAYNAQLLRQRSYIKATKFGFLATKGSFHPKVDLSVNGESKNEFEIGLGQREKINALVTFNYNLYNGGRDEATAIRLLSKMKEQKYLYQDIERNLIFEVKVLNSSVSSLSQSLKLTQSEVIAARKVVESYWIAFRNGTQDLQALQLAQRNLNSAEQSYAKYKKDLILNNFALMKKTGALLQFLELPYKKEASQFKGDLNLFYEFSELE